MLIFNFLVASVMLTLNLQYSGVGIADDTGILAVVILVLIVDRSFLLHCVKSAHIRSYSGRHFPTFGLNTER